MSNEPVTTIVGNLAADAELRYTPSGAAVANFRVGSTPSTFDRNTNEWVDGTTLWMDCTAWRGKAEAAGATLVRGARVIVLGHLRQEEWTDKDSGGRRSKTALTVVDFGIVPMPPKAGEPAQPARQATRSQQAPDDNPWSTAPASGAGTDEAPPW
jgi:single-strand DNA-binding protein